MSAIEIPAPRRWLPAIRPAVPWKLIRIAIFYLGLFLLWELAYRMETWPPYAFPAPGKVWDTLWSRIQDGTIKDATQLTMQRMLIGYSLSILVGLTIGIAMGTMKWIDETLGTLVLGLQSLPSVAWLPLSLIWFGLNERAIIFVVLMGSVNSIAISARTGVKAIPQLQMRAARMFGGHRWQQYAYVVIPGMFPAMVQGLKLGWSFAWRSLVAAELLFVSLSLGNLLQTGRDLSNPSLTISIMLVIIAIGLTVDRLIFARLEGWVAERWGLAR